MFYNWKFEKSSIFLAIPGIGIIMCKVYWNRNSPRWSPSCPPIIFRNSFALDETTFNSARTKNANFTEGKCSRYRWFDHQVNIFLDFVSSAGSRCHGFCFQHFLGYYQCLARKKLKLKSIYILVQEKQSMALKDILKATYDAIQLFHSVFYM